MSAIATGTAVEQLASNYLQAAKLQILQRNFHSKYGEIDIIARDVAELVFAEVRYRKGVEFGSAAETVTVTKQQKIIRAAQFYLQTHTWAQQLNCRFDVIAISCSIQSPQIDWIKDAFHA